MTRNLKTARMNKKATKLQCALLAMDRQELATAIGVEVSGLCRKLSNQEGWSLSQIGAAMELASVDIVDAEEITVSREYLEALKTVVSESLKGEE